VDAVIRLLAIDLAGEPGQRLAAGVNQGADTWARNVQPALDVLKGLQLPPRGARRSPANQQRANMVAIELGKLKDRG
jgi:hypothetical protein